MTDDEATFILACFLLCDPHYYQIGGPAADGSDNTNHLSYLILEAAHQLKSTANITIRVFDNMDEGLFRRGLEILFEDRLAYPRFSGDKALVSGFMKTDTLPSLPEGGSRWGATGCPCRGWNIP